MYLRGPLKIKILLLRCGLFRMKSQAFSKDRNYRGVVNTCLSVEWLRRSIHTCPRLWPEHSMCIQQIPIGEVKLKHLHAK